MEKHLNSNVRNLASCRLVLKAEVVALRQTNAQGDDDGGDGHNDDDGGDHASVIEHNHKQVENHTLIQYLQNMHINGQRNDDNIIVINNHHSYNSDNFQSGWLSKCQTLHQTQLAPRPR